MITLNRIRRGRTPLMRLLCTHAVAVPAAAAVWLARLLLTGTGSVPVTVPGATAPAPASGQPAAPFPIPLFPL